jgi:2-polyprenyl-3-methyl-5-hydroxy-6-metoxy-1,4-benzoquinol methylase
VAGLEALDLGCGQGYFSRELARAGAHVTAVDLAEEALAYAHRHEARAPLGIDYQPMSAADVGARWPARFDLAAACMSLHDMAAPAEVLRSTYQALRPGGRLAFSIPHPATDTPYREWELDAAGNRGPLKIDRYFESGPTVTHWKMRRLTYHWTSPYWRHTLAEWSELIAGAGFLIRRLAEPRPSLEQVARVPHIEDAYRLPSFLIWDVVKME